MRHSTRWEWRIRHVRPAILATGAQPPIRRRTTRRPWCFIRDFGDTATAGHCTADAAHGTGLCYTCGPAAPDKTQQLCGQTCIPATHCCADNTTDVSPNDTCPPDNSGTTTTCCSGTDVGACVDLQTDEANCGQCGNTCGSTVTCEQGACCAQPSSDSTYEFSCFGISQTCTSEGTILTAACRRRNGTFNFTASINVNTCQAQGYYIANCDGVLTCGEC